jgi:hypothetical protein
VRAYEAFDDKAEKADPKNGSANPPAAS